MQSNNSQISIQKGHFLHPCFCTPGGTQADAASHYFVSQIKEQYSFLLNDHKSFKESFWAENQTWSNMDVKNKKCVHRVPIKLANYQTIENEAATIDRNGKGSYKTIASEKSKNKIKVPVKIKREVGELTKERRKYVTKFEEIIL